MSPSASHKWLDLARKTGNLYWQSPFGNPATFLKKRPLGFAPPPRDRFAFVQDARKYTRGKELVAIGLIVASSNAQRLIGAPVERYGATPSSLVSLHVGQTCRRI
jgi:hypothetical protein